MKKSAMTLGLTLAAVIMTGCGSTEDAGGSTSGSTDQVPEAVTKLVKEAGQPAPWRGPTTSPPMLKDKFIVSIPCSLAAEGCVRWNEGVKAAADYLGWRVQTIDPAFDLSKMDQAMEQAINLKADAIVTTVIDPAWIPNSLAKARAAGIPVIGGANAQEDEPITEDGFSHIMNLNGDLQGEWVAAAACKDLNAQGNVVVLNDPTFAVLTQRVDAMTSYLKDNCPDINVKVEKVASTDAGTVLQNKVSALVQRDPDLGAILAPVDNYVTDINTALTQLGNSKIGIYSIDGSKSVVQDIADGGNAKVTIGSALEWEGWSTIDEANRLMQGEPPLEDDGIPGRLVDSSFIPDDNLYIGDLDYEAEFKKLWSTGTLNP